MAFQLHLVEAVAIVLLFAGFLFLWGGGFGYVGFLDLASMAIFGIVIALAVGRTQELQSRPNSP